MYEQKTLVGNGYDLAVVASWHAYVFCNTTRISRLASLEPDHKLLKAGREQLDGNDGDEVSCLL